MLSGSNTLDNLLTLRVAVQAVKEFRLGDVVSLDDGLLSVRVRDVFTQHAHACWLNHVRVDAVVDNQFDKGGVVVQCPRDSGGEHLVSIGVEPLVMQGFCEGWNLDVFLVRDGSTSVDAESCGFR